MKFWWHVCLTCNLFHRINWTHFLAKGVKSIFPHPRFIRVTLTVWVYQWDAATVALYTQRLHIIDAVKARHFSTFVCVQWTKQLQHKADPVCQFIQHSSTADSKSPDGTHHNVDICVCVFFFSQRVSPGIHLLMCTCMDWLFIIIWMLF